MAAAKTFCMCHKKPVLYRGASKRLGAIFSSTIQNRYSRFVSCRAAPVGAPDVWSFLTKIYQFSGRNPKLLHPILSCQPLPGNGLFGRSFLMINGIRIVCFGRIFSSLRTYCDPRIFSRGCFLFPCPPIHRAGNTSEALVNERPCSIIPAIFFHGHTADHPAVILPVNEILLPHLESDKTFPAAFASGVFFPLVQRFICRNKCHRYHPFFCWTD